VPTIFLVDFNKDPDVTFRSYEEDFGTGTALGVNDMTFG
jgi:hypothetical protein